MDTPFPRQRFWKAYYAALLTVLYVKGLEAIAVPDGLTAAFWLDPLTLPVLVLLGALVLAPIALLNTTIFVRPFAAMRSAHWRHVPMWTLWIGYGAALLYATFRLTASTGIAGQILGLMGLLALTTLNYRFQQTSHPHRLLLGLATVAAVVPAFLLLRPVPRVTADAPIIWVTESLNYSEPYTAPPVYWQPYQCVHLQWKGNNYRLDGMSPAFAFRRHEVLTLEGRDLVVSPLKGPSRCISLKAQIPNYQYILNMQPTRDGVLLNVFSPDYRVVRVNLDTDTVAPVPHAWRVRGAETTDRYVVRSGGSHQVRDGRDRVLRQHGMYPWHFRTWDADPIDDLFAITNLTTVTLIGPDSLTMSTITPGISMASITMQPGLHQLWIAEAVRDRYTPDIPSCRLLLYSYNGRRLGERTIIGANVLHAMPVEESVAEYLIGKYSAPAAQ